MIISLTRPTRKPPMPSKTWTNRFVILRLCKFADGNRRIVLLQPMQTRVSCQLGGRIWRKK